MRQNETADQRGCRQVVRGTSGQEHRSAAFQCGPVNPEQQVEQEDERHEDQGQA